VLAFVRQPLGGVVAAAAILVLGAQSGGFLADTWGWAGVPLLLLVGVIAVSAPAISFGRLESFLLLAFAAFAVWTALSAVWAPTPGPPLLEGERALVYLAALAAVFLAGARSVALGVLGAALVLCLWALWGRLGHTGGGRLEGPIGYTNGLGLVAAIGTLLALGFALRRPVAAAATVVFLPALVLTFSRGSWVGGAPRLAGVGGVGRP
jgi:hypothetical protein